MKHKYYSTNMKPNKCIRQDFFKPTNEKYGKVLNLGGFWPPTPLCLPNMKTIPSKLWSVASGNQTVSGGGSGGQDQSIPDFVRGYN
jgi:hypothetical protein